MALSGHKTLLNIHSFYFNLPHIQLCCWNIKLIIFFTSFTKQKCIHVFIKSWKKTPPQKTYMWNTNTKQGNRRFVYNAAQRQTAIKKKKEKERAWNYWNIHRLIFSSILIWLMSFTNASEYNWIFPISFFLFFLEEKV